MTHNAQSGIVLDPLIVRRFVCILDHSDIIYLFLKYIIPNSNLSKIDQEQVTKRVYELLQLDIMYPKYNLFFIVYDASCEINLNECSHYHQ